MMITITEMTLPMMSFIFMSSHHIFFLTFFDVTCGERTANVRALREGQYTEYLKASGSILQTIGALIELRQLGVPLQHPLEVVPHHVHHFVHL
jgi:hypothetical protein